MHDTFQPAPTTFQPSGHTVGVVVACTFDPLGLQGPLTVWLKQLTGLRCQLSWVGYGMVVDAIRDEDSSWNRNSKGLNVLLMRWDDLFRASRLAGHVVTNAAAELNAALRASCAVRRGHALVLIPPSSAQPSSHAHAYADELAVLRSISGVHVVDEQALAKELNGLRYHSAFLDQVAHAPYSPTGTSVFAGIICRHVARCALPARKAICLDCDNTLWGGAVGELGPHGVVMSEPFLSVQRRFVAQQQQGLLLCLVSRNHEEDVRAVLRLRRDEMVLKEEHVVAIRANWGAKSANVLELAGSLCLDPASFVFVDDSPAECAEVALHAGPKGVAIAHFFHPPAVHCGCSDAHNRRMPQPRAIWRTTGRSCGSKAKAPLKPALRSARTALASHAASTLTTAKPGSWSRTYFTRPIAFCIPPVPIKLFT